MTKEKFCVFCGKKPKNKTKEHILPKWLINLTGKPNRQINVGIDFSNFFNSEYNLNLRKYSINSFTLPACNECNSKYSILENKVKLIMEKVLSNLPINSFEIDLLLDWFDKIRIGLWLMYFTLDKNWTGIYPKFFINNRIGQYDRILHIIKCNETEKRLNFIGVQNFAFQRTPSVFGLIINNFVFINLSYNFLLSRRIGFPYPINTYLIHKNDQYIFDVELNEKGFQRIFKPIIRTTLPLKGNIFFQAAYNDKLIISNKNYSDIIYNNNYVKKNSLKFGKSKIIYKNQFINNPNNPIKLSPDFSYNDCYNLYSEVAREVLQLQLWLCNYNSENIKLDKLNTELRKEIKKQFNLSKKFTKMFLKLI